MNRKGFTIVELLAILVLLAIVVGLMVSLVRFNLDSAKEKTEEVFVDTLKDAVDMFLSSNPSGIKFETACDKEIIKKYGNVKVYRAKYYDETGIGGDLTFKDIIDSDYKPLSESDFVNPGNEDVACEMFTTINVYRDEDYVYYYSIDKNALGCLKNIGGEYDGLISNLPEGYSCE